MNLDYDITFLPDGSWIIRWDDQQDNEFREATGQWLWNAIDLKLTSLGGVVYLTREHGLPAMEVDMLPYCSSRLTFNELTQENEFDPWAD